jgi:hypothetical protein
MPTAENRKNKIYVGLWALVFAILMQMSAAILPAAATDAPDDREHRENSLGQFADALGKANSEFVQWITIQKGESLSKLGQVLEFKVLQTNVFFGGFMAIFLTLGLVFVVIFVYNIGRDTVAGAVRKAKKLSGREAEANVYSMQSPLSTAVRTRSDRSRAEPAVDKPASKKRFLFCEVLMHFVNPSIPPAHLQDALSLQRQGGGKKVGEILKENGMITDADIEKTVRIQKQYRQR